MENKHQIDREVIDGLSITLDSKKVKSNCKLYNIDMLVNKVNGDFFSKISKIYNKTFVTSRIGKNLIQFKVESNLDINELNNIDNRIIPNEFKILILEAYRLITINTLYDLLK